MNLKNFFLIQVIALGCFIASSFAGIPALTPIVFVTSLALLIGLIKKLGTIREDSLNQKNLWGWVLVGAYSAVVLSWYSDLWVMPSNDDTINHLGFLQAILNSKMALLGQIDRPGWQSFGQSRYHFYPTGSHALMALWITAFQWVLPSLSWVLLFKTFLITLLCFWPAVLWWGSLRAFPKISSAFRFFLIAATITLPAFPLNALGEGGFSRIVAMTLIVPFWFEAIRQPKSFKFGFFWGAILAPILLFVHPSTLPFLALGVLFFRFRAMVGAFGGGILGGLIFIALMKSAQQEITDPTFMGTLLKSMGVTEGAWLERMKGPFHYWFTDPDGFGKFFSPKNIFIYWALILAVIGKLPRKIILLFLTPFLFAALALIPHPVAQQLGVVFYHAVKRIAEIMPLLGLTLALFSAEYLTQKKTKWVWTYWASAAFVVLGLAFIYVFQLRSVKELNQYHDLFGTVKTHSANQMAEKLKLVPSSAVILVDRHEYDSLRFLGPQEILTLKPECAEVGALSSYCQKRTVFASEVLNQRMVERKETWWLPPAVLDAEMLIKAQGLGFKNVTLSDGAHLIQIAPSVRLEP